MSVSLFGDLTLFVALPARVEIVGIELANVGILLGIHRMIRIPGNSIGAFFINKFQRKPFLAAGLGLAVLSTAGYGFVYGLWPFIINDKPHCPNP